MPDRKETRVLSMTGPRLLTRRQVAERLGISIAATYTLPGLPEPKRFTSRIVRWVPEEIESWIASRGRKH